jgi:hypothetical protein
LQSKFKQAVAAAGGVPLGTVTIDQIQALERRAANTRVDVKVMASDAPAAESISKAITLDRINYELAKRGLPRASMLEPPSVFSTNAQEQIQSVIQLGQAGIAGIAVGGSSLLLLVFGTYLYYQAPRRTRVALPKELSDVPMAVTWTKKVVPTSEAVSSTATRTAARQKKLQLANEALPAEVCFASFVILKDGVNAVPFLPSSASLIEELMLSAITSDFHQDDRIIF